MFGEDFGILTHPYLSTDLTQNLDKGLGIVYYDVISDSNILQVDTTPNSLDNATTDISSSNVPK